MAAKYPELGHQRKIETACAVSGKLKPDRRSDMPFEATYGFLLTLGLMLAVIFTGILVRRKTRQNVMAPARVSGAVPSAGE